MSKEEIFNKVQEIFRDIFDEDDLIIQDNTNASDIEDWDSLNQINIISAVEKEFKIRFELTEITNFKNVGDMIDLIVKKIINE